MTDVRIDGICAEVRGDGQAVVMVHGLGGSSNTFEPQMPVLPHYRVIRPDLPGSGRSPVPYSPPCIESYAADIGRMCKALGVDSAHFVGHSMGTLICQHIAAKQPHRVASLTLFGPLLEPPEPARERLQARAAKARAEGMAAVSKDIIDGQLSSDTKSRQPAVTAFVRECVMRQDVEGYAQTCEALAAGKQADLRALNCPVLLVTGDEDAVTPPAAAQAIADKCKNSSVEILNRCGHWTTVERVDECNALLREFLQRHTVQ